MTIATLALCLIRHTNTFSTIPFTCCENCCGSFGISLPFNNARCNGWRGKETKETLILHTKDRLIKANGRATDQVSVWLVVPWKVIVYKKEHVTLSTPKLGSQSRKKLYGSPYSTNSAMICATIVWVKIGRSEWPATWPCATKLIDNTQRNGICHEYRDYGKQKMICEFHTSCPRVVLLPCRLPRLDALCLFFFYFISLNATRWWILRTAFNSNYCDMNDLCTVVQLYSCSACDWIMAGSCSSQSKCFMLCMFMFHFFCLFFSWLLCFRTRDAEEMQNERDGMDERDRERNWRTEI